MTMLTPDLLRQIMQCPAERAAECFPAMVRAMQTFSIDTPARITCFMTQVKWESGGLVYFAELASGSAYEGRASLGNNQPGDGPRFKGSGPIQVTGRSNFTAAQHALDAAGIKINILTDPSLARTVRYGFWISSWWWAAHGGNSVAERTPLSAASIACGRLVNRGDANSQFQAQDEEQRVQAFQHVAAFGSLTLAATGVGAPTTKEDEDMPLNDADKAWIVKAITDAVHADNVRQAQVIVAGHTNKHYAQAEVNDVYGAPSAMSLLAKLTKVAK